MPVRDRGYEDRRAAGRRLAEELSGLELNRPVVLALPRGGVPVGREVAEALHAPLDVLVVRKVGAPGHEELGLGAVGERGVRVLDQELVGRLGVSGDALEPIIEREEREVQRRVRRYRGDRDPVEVDSRDVVIVDDGVATGVTARAGVRIVRQWEPRRIVLAVPVGAPHSLEELSVDVDELVCPLRPPGFRAVGLWYRDFHQVDDEEVTAHLEAVAEARGADREPDERTAREADGP